MQAVFLRAVNLSISASYVILAVMLMRLVLRRAPRWICCALWALAAFRLVCPFTLESALSLLPSAETFSPAIAELETARPETPYVRTGFPALDRQANDALAELAGGTEDAATPTESAPAIENAPALPSRPSTGGSVIVSAVAVATVVWLGGAALMALYGLASWLVLRLRVRTAVHWRDELWQSEWVDAPFVFGVFRPRIYLPFHLDEAAAAQIVAHERAHIRRHDQLTKLFAWSLLSVYWFNPLNWAAYALLCRDIELACDERVVRGMDADMRRRYARALLAWGVSRPAVAVSPLAFGEVGLRERIMNVMKYKHPAKWAAALAVVLIAASGVFLLTDPVVRADGGVPVVSPVTDAIPPTAAPAEAPDAADTASAPILTVRPRDITGEEAKAIVTAIFGDAPVYKDTGRTKQELAEEIEKSEQILADAQADGDDRTIREAARTLEELRLQYESAPDGSERELCDWTFRSEDGYSGEQTILARAALDGEDYAIGARNQNAPDGTSLHSLYINRLTGHFNAAPSDPPAEAQIDALTGQVRGWLDKMGLVDWSVAAAEVVDDTGAVIVTAQPSYNGVVQLPFDWWHDPPADQTLWFSFFDGVLDACIYSSPLEVVASQPADPLMSLGDALAAAGLEDGLAALDWQFCYTRVPDADGSGNYHLVPSYRCGPVNDQVSDTDILIVSAVDGSLIADERTAEAGPATGADAAVQKIEVRWGVTGQYDYAELGAFDMPAGSTISLCAIWFPVAVNAHPAWTVDDPAVVRLAPGESGIFCDCTMTGQSGQSTVLHVTVNEMTVDITVNIS